MRYALIQPLRCIVLPSRHEAETVDTGSVVQFRVPTTECDANHGEDQHPGNAGECTTDQTSSSRYILTAPELVPARRL